MKDLPLVFVVEYSLGKDSVRVRSLAEMLDTNLYDLRGDRMTYVLVAMFNTLPEADGYAHCFKLAKNEAGATRRDSLWFSDLPQIAENAKVAPATIFERT